MLKCKRIGERDALHDINPTPAPRGVPQARHNRGSGRHSQSLGWYRGKQSGQIDAVLTLQEMGHTRIAAKLQKHYGFDDDGGIPL